MKTMWQQRWMTKERLIWAALTCSLLLHFGALLAQPVYLWLQGPEVLESALQQSTQRMQAQALAERSQGAAATPRARALTDELQVRLALADAEPARAATVTGQDKPRQVAKPVKPAAAAKPPKPQVVATREAAQPALSASAPQAIEAAPDVGEASSVQLAQAEPVVAASAVTVAQASSSAAAQPAARRMAPGFPRQLEATFAMGGWEARLSWQRDAQGNYRTELKVPALISYQSRGVIVGSGLKPSVFREERALKSPRQADFDWAAGVARVGTVGEQQPVPLHDGDQDALSAMWQLALQGIGERGLQMTAFVGHKAYEDLPFHLLGIKQLQIDGQAIEVLVVAGERKGDRLAFGFAPQWGNIPVEIEIKGQKAVVVQLQVDGKTLLDRRPGPADRRGAH